MGGDRFNPEEFNRQVISIIAEYNFAPTELEGIDAGTLKLVGTGEKNVYASRRIEDLIVARQ